MALAVDGPLGHYGYTEPTSWNDCNWDNVDPGGTDYIRSLYWALLERYEAVRIARLDIDLMVPLAGARFRRPGPYQVLSQPVLEAIRNALSTLAGYYVDWEATMAQIEAGGEHGQSVHWSWAKLVRKYPDLAMVGCGRGCTRAQPAAFLAAARHAIDELYIIEWEPEPLDTSARLLDPVGSSEGSDCSIAKAKAEAVAGRVRFEGGNCHHIYSDVAGYYDDGTDLPSMWEASYAGDHQVLDLDLSVRYRTHPQDGGDMLPAHRMVAWSAAGEGMTINGVPSTWTEYLCPLGWAEGLTVETHADGTRLHLDPEIGTVPSAITRSDPEHEWGCHDLNFHASLWWYMDYSAGTGFRFFTPRNNDSEGDNE